MLKLAKESDGQIFVRDPFNPICFSEDPEKYIEEESILSILTAYEHNRDVLELKGEELLFLQNKIQQTSDVLTLTESTEISANEHEVMRHSSRRRNRCIVEAG